MRRGLPPPPNLPILLLRRLEEQFGLSGLETCRRGFERERLPTLRINHLTTTTEDLMTWMREHQISFERLADLPGGFRIRNRSSHELLELEPTIRGWWYLQSATAMLPVLWMNPKPGERIADLCAAPGGKTSQIASVTQNQATIDAFENDRGRYEKLLHTLTLQQVKVKATYQDALTIGVMDPPVYDAVLLDAPCSAEGRMIRADKRSWSYWSPLTGHTCAATQRPLLEHAAQLVKPGGRLVYSTCTLAAIENEELIRDFLGNHPEFQVVTHTPPTWMKTRSTRYGTTILVSDTHEGGFVSILKKQAA